MSEEATQQLASITDRLNNLINKIANSGSIDIADSDYDEIRNFLYLWNLFEDKLFQRNYDYTLPDDFKQLTIDPKVIEDTLSYFKSRYKDNAKFNNLHLHRCDNPAQVSDVINEIKTSVEDKLQVINTIIYRYRCNLFHGTKEIQSLWAQKDNFIHANQFMLACLEAKFDIK